MLNESLETLQDYESKIASSKVDIATAIVAKGGTVNTGDGLMDFAEDIASITNGATLYTPTINPSNSSSNGMQTKDIHFFVNNNVLFVYGYYTSMATSQAGGEIHNSNIVFGDILKNFGVSSETTKSFAWFSLTTGYTSGTQRQYGFASIDENSDFVPLKIYNGSTSYKGYIIGYCDFN